MADIIKVTTKGQVTLPARIRADLGIDEETYLLAEGVGEFVLLRKAESRFQELTAQFRREARGKGITREQLLRRLKARRGRTR